LSEFSISDSTFFGGPRGGPRTETRSIKSISRAGWRKSVWAQFENKPPKGVYLELMNSENGKFPFRSIPEFLSSKFKMIHDPEVGNGSVWENHPARWHSAGLDS